MPEDLKRVLKSILTSNEWLEPHKGEVTMQDELAWVGARLYIPPNPKNDGPTMEP